MKNLNSKISIIALCMIMLLCISSCRSSKNTSAYTETQRDWHDLQVPIKVVVKSPINLSLSGRATLIRDSVINISMRVLGFEVAIAHLSTDSLFFVDKHNKYYFSESLKSVMGSQKLSMRAIQDLLLGKEADSNLSFKNPNTDKTISVSFDEPVATPFGNMSSVTNIDAREIDIDASLIWSFDDAKWDQYPNIKFNAPNKKYKRISLDSIKTLLAN